MIVKASFFVEELGAALSEDDADDVLVAELSSCADSPAYVTLTIGGNPSVVVYVRDLEQALKAVAEGTGEL